MAVVPEPEPDRDSHTPEQEIVENLIDTEPLQVCLTYYPISYQSDFNTHVCKALGCFQENLSLVFLTRLQSNLHVQLQ